MLPCKKKTCFTNNPKKTYEHNTETHYSGNRPTSRENSRGESEYFTNLQNPTQSSSTTGAVFFCIGRVFHHHHRLSFGPWALNDELSHQSTGNDLSRKVEPTRSWKKPWEMGPPKSPTFCDSWGFLFIKNGSEIPPLSVLESGRILKISSDTLKHQYNRHCKTQGAKRAMFLAREPLKATQTPQVWEESSESSDMQWVWEAG